MPSPRLTRPDDAPLINEEADRILGRIILRYGAATFLLLLAATFGMAFVNIPQSPLFPARRFLDTLSILIVLTPFFVGTNRLFAARLQLGRALVQKRAWREAVAALEPFASRGQRFLDTTGEAHFLLAQAYAGVGESDKADTARAFLRRHRRGVWADRLKAGKPAPVAPSARTQEKRQHPSNLKRRRRF